MVSTKKNIRKTSKKTKTQLNEEQIVGIAFIITVAIIGLFMIISNVNFNTSAKQIKAQKVSERGGLEGGLAWPFGIAVTPDSKYLYAANYGTHNINKYKLPDNPAQPWDLLKTWGRQGKDSGQFDQPSGICLDAVGNVYVADAVNGRIQKFNPDGKYMMQINYSTNGFWRPRNVLVTKNGDIYVANTGKWNIYHFNSQGAMIGTFIELYGEVFGLATDSIGRIYVANAGSKTIDILTPDLKLLKKRKVAAWRNNEGMWPMIAIDSKNRIYCVSQNEKKIVVYDTVAPNFPCLGEIRNDTNGQQLFTNPLGIAIDSQDNLYITEKLLGKVLKIKPVFN